MGFRRPLKYLAYSLGTLVVLLALNFAVFEFGLNQTKAYCNDQLLGLSRADAIERAKSFGLENRDDARESRLAVFSGIEAMCLLTVDEQGRIADYELIE